MKIVAAEAIPIRIPLKKPFTIAVGALTHSTQVLVRLMDDEGRQGWGETCTFLEVYGYDQADLHRALSDHLLPAVLGMDPRDAVSMEKILDGVMPHNLMAKTAVDVAATDLSARAAGVSLSDFCGGARVGEIPLVGVVDMVSPAEAPDLARAQLAMGFGAIKIKIGGEEKSDQARVEAVRKAVGDEVPLRVDGNAGYDRLKAMRVFTSMDSLGLQWIEQPLPPWDLDGHAALAARLDTPVAVDESMYTIHDARECIARKAADVVNIKVVKCGGIHRSQKIAALCSASGIPCFLGGNLDLSLSMAAAAHFYAATEGVVAGAEILGSTMLYLDDVVKEPLTVSHGNLALPKGPGLGLEVDWEKITRYRVDR